jgi:hypothetical protein
VNFSFFDLEKLSKESSVAAIREEESCADGAMESQID